MTTATARVHRGVESLEPPIGASRPARDAREQWRLDTAPGYAPSGDWVEGALHRGQQETLIERIKQYGYHVA
jgi:hypothetical protein